MLTWTLKIVYRRYASLYFICGIDDLDNELATLEIIHRYVEILDRHFGNVCYLFNLNFPSWTDYEESVN